MKHRILLLLLCLTAATGLRAQEERSLFRKTVFTVNGASQTDSDSLEVAHQEYPADSIAALADAEHSDEELLELLRMMPNIEIGKGITFQPRSKWYSMTLRFRMQNMVGLSFDRDFSLTQTEARVKRLRLRFDGYIYSPKLVYSIQLGFTPYDTKELPNGNTNIVRDAIVYYVPNAHWNIGFGQTKIKANRARVNSSSALQFVDRSIVNSEFNLDRDFGFFGEYNGRIGKRFRLSAKGSITLGEGRNWSTSSDGGLAYTGRLELYPLGRFKSKGDVIEGDFEYDEQVRILLAGAYSYNSRAVRIQGQNGALMPEGEHRNLGSYFFDFILKYRGFAFYTDFMGRTCDTPLFDGNEGIFVYTGKGLNLQTSYLIKQKWEIALRNSTMFPDGEVQSLAGYRRWNQTTIGVTRYLIGHSLKLQADASYNHQSGALNPNYNRWEIRFQVELGL
ncbi:porin [Alistipes sp.]|uniref:porin n=1 Tax=Alistipes sp. TaxID=1872444 RepID=UPI0031FCB990